MGHHEHVVAGRGHAVPAVRQVEQAPPRPRRRRVETSSRRKSAVGRVTEKTRFVVVAERERHVTVAVPVEQRPDRVVVVRDEAVQRHRGAHDHSSHGSCLSLVSGSGVPTCLASATHRLNTYSASRVGPDHLPCCREPILPGDCGDGRRRPNPRTTTSASFLLWRAWASRCSSSRPGRAYGVVALLGDDAADASYPTPGTRGSSHVARRRGGARPPVRAPRRGGVPGGRGVRAAAPMSELDDE